MHNGMPIVLDGLYKGLDKGFLGEYVVSFTLKVASRCSIVFL